MDDKDWEEIAWLIMGGVGLMVAMRLWSTTIKPWLEGFVPKLVDGGRVAVGSFEVATSDAVAAGVALVLVLIVVGTLRSSVKSRKRAKHQQDAH